MKWTHIYFDLDNTLYDHEQAFRKTILYCAKDLLLRKEASVSPEEWFSVFKRYCDDYWEHYESGRWSRETYQIRRFQAANQTFNITCEDEEALVFQSKYESNVAAFAELFPEADRLLDKLTKLQMHKGIITNGSTEVQRSKINQLRLNRWIKPEDIYISQDVGIAKPNSEIFHYAKEGKGKYLYIGDSWHQDIKPALEAGFDAIYFNSRQHTTSNSSNVPEVFTFQQMISVVCGDS